MAFRTLDNITVPGAGTAVRLTPSDLVAASIIVTALNSNTGIVVVAEVGKAVAASFKGVLLSAGQSFAINPGGISGKDRRQDINEMEVDVAVNDEGVSISYLEK